MSLKVLVVPEDFTKQFVALRATGKSPHEGRKKLMTEAMRNWSRIKSRCPEDVGRLIEKLQL